MICSICQSAAHPHSVATALNKYVVQYYQCSYCQFIFTETPYWLSEAYASPITTLDIGLVSRNEQVANATQAVIRQWFDSDARFIDYGGGYGMLVRMMRDRGYDFYRQDAYCPNLFAQQFDVTDVAPFRAALTTAFEVLEHLPDPATEVRRLLSNSDALLFSTIVQPSPTVMPDTWWYFIAHTGQHVSLFSRKSLQVLADRLNVHYVWNKFDLHLFSRKPIPRSTFRLLTHPRVSGLLNQLLPHPPSRLASDFEQAVQQVHTQQS